MESIIGPRIGTMFDRDQLVRYADTNPKFTYDTKDGGFQTFARSYGYPVPKDETLWCLDFLSPGIYQSRLECLWEQYKEEDLATVIAKVDGQVKAIEVPGDTPVKTSLWISTAQGSDHADTLLRKLKLLKGGEVAISPEDVSSAMEFDMKVSVDKSLPQNFVNVKYQKTESRLERILAMM